MGCNHHEHSIGRSSRSIQFAVVDRREATISKDGNRAASGMIIGCQATVHPPPSTSPTSLKRTTKAAGPAVADAWHFLSALPRSPSSLERGGCSDRGLLSPFLVRRKAQRQRSQWVGSLRSFTFYCGHWLGGLSGRTGRRFGGTRRQETTGRHRFRSRDAQLRGRQRSLANQLRRNLPLNVDSQPQRTRLRPSRQRLNHLKHMAQQHRFVANADRSLAKATSFVPRAGLRCS